jgi:predicted secreted protein
MAAPIQECTFKVNISGASRKLHIGKYITTWINDQLFIADAASDALIRKATTEQLCASWSLSKAAGEHICFNTPFGMITLRSPTDHRSVTCDGVQFNVRVSSDMVHIRTGDGATARDYFARVSKPADLNTFRMWMHEGDFRVVMENNNPRIINQDNLKFMIAVGVFTVGDHRYIIKYETITARQHAESDTWVNCRFPNSQKMSAFLDGKIPNRTPGHLYCITDHSNAFVTVNGSITMFDV